MRDEFMIERQGKKYVLYAGLLDGFHALRDQFDDARPVIETELFQIPQPDGSPTGENVAIVVAKVGYMSGEKWVYGPFTGIGDASPENVGNFIVPHIIRMAETRAKARALRDAINVGVTAFEELGGDEASPGEDNGNVRDINEAKPQPRVQYARKSQQDLLKTLAVEWRGEGGVERLENRIGKPINRLTREEADEWIDRLTPEGR